MEGKDQLKIEDQYLPITNPNQVCHTIIQLCEGTTLWANKKITTLSKRMIKVYTCITCLSVLGHM